MAHGINVRRVLNSRLAWGAGPTILGVEGATVEIEKETADYTTFESGGFYEVADCVAKGSGSAKSDWDAAKNPFVSPPTLYPNDAAGPGQFYVSQADPTFFLFPVMAIPSCTTDMQMSGKLVSFDFDWLSNGTFATPSGEFGPITN